MSIKHLKEVIKGKVPLFKKRSSKWPSLRKAFLFNNSECAACGCKEFLEVHHIKPFHSNPELELEETNLMVLCDKPGPDNCHIVLGHWGNYKKINEDVVKDAAEFRKSLTLK